METRDILEKKLSFLRNWKQAPSLHMGAGSWPSSLQTRTYSAPYPHPLSMVSLSVVSVSCGQPQSKKY
jgi:hypothetical protein